MYHTWSQYSMTRQSSQLNMLVSALLSPLAPDPC